MSEARALERALGAPAARARPDGAWIPSAPLILSAYGSHDSLKRERLREHLLFAAEKGVLDRVTRFILALPPSDWEA